MIMIMMMNYFDSTNNWSISRESQSHPYVINCGDAQMGFLSRVCLSHHAFQSFIFEMVELIGCIN